MQYPIIDLITDAYINNGWTGLNIIEGTNLINVESLLPVSLSGVQYFSFPVNSELITYGENNDMTFKLVGTLGENKTRFALFIYDTINNEALYVGNNQQLTPDNNFTVFGTFSNSGFIDLTKNLTIRIYAQPYEGSSSTITGLMIAKGHVDEYVPYTPPTTDISNRLKLPLPHYFPHPVIDALQRAAAGTQTADDTEILRHYLTPLGIGGI